MSKQLVVVESPTKARTLAKFLGDGYSIEATMGHVRDLPQKKLGVDIRILGENDIRFDPQYVSTKEQEKRMQGIGKIASDAGTVYLATDPDREGEAIAFHMVESLKLKADSYKRIVFHEITERAIKEALEHPRGLDMKLVNAQQARRVLDRLVGYKLSPLLWKKVRRGLSAGRVQSVAVRLVVEREREIEAFKPEEYWDILVELKTQNSKLKNTTQESKLTVKLTEKDGGKLTIGNQQEAEGVERELRDLNTEYRILNIEKKDFRRSPPAPFTTSTLQQAGANKLGWSAKRTMQVAQNLYEEGLITYHRTDSTNIAEEAFQSVNRLISERFGKEYALEKPRIFKTKSKMAQEAHEAVRPTDVRQDPMTKSQETSMNRDQQRLYEMIWKRFVGCQMADARGTSVKVKVNGKSLGQNNYGLEAKGETVTFDGWYKLNGEGGEEVVLPEVSEGEKLEFVDLTSEQKFTQGPARYNDASLVKALEEMGIGRPSTYAPTLSTIQDRQYVEKIEKRFKPTELGVAVNDFLVTNFPKEIDYEFTANMEYGLDEVANGEKDWQALLSGFYGPFEEDVKSVEQTASRVKVEVEKTGEKCPECTSSGSAQVGDLVIRIGRFGRFVACSRYPECKYKANYQNKIGMKCPKCTEGDVIMRKTRRGKSFYGCSNYPKCDFASWLKPKMAAIIGENEEQKS